jgi:Zn-dependent protease
MLNLDITTLISRALTLVIAFTVHEFAHAWTATMFGDDTPRINGRLTLNPISHLDPMGSLLLLFAGFGWAKPVPVNPYVLNQRSRSALMLVSLAGPLSNLMLAVLAAIPFRLGLVSVVYAFAPNDAILPTQEQFLLEFIYINLLLMLFNLIPISPLDGEKILEFFLPPSLAKTFDTIRPYGPIILMVIIFVLPFMGVDVLGTLLYPPLNAMLSFLLGL